MTYTKNTWVDQNVERPKTYEFSDNPDGSVTLIESFGNVVELGTPVNAANMNHIEDGIAGCAIRKYNVCETYENGEWVVGVVNNKKGIYSSKTDNNIGNALSDATKWDELQLGGNSRNVGEIVISTTPLIDDCLHLLDGALLSGSGSYAAFVNYIAELYNSGDYTNLFATEANWQTSVTNYGVCGKFVYTAASGNDPATVRLPKITGFIEGASNISTLGDLVEAGLPDHNHKVEMSDNEQGVGYPTQGSSLVNPYYTGNASLSNPIYGRSNTVQPQAIKALYYIVTATSTKTGIEVDIDEIATDLNGKADADLSNVSSTKAILEESYVNGSSWYRIYSDGWCEQGGVATPTALTLTNTITFLKAFANTNYYINANNSSEHHVTIYPNTVSTAYFGNITSNFALDLTPVNWMAQGYIR